MHLQKEDWIPTYDCEPALYDLEILEFCRNGFLKFENLIPEDINQKTLDFLQKVPEENHGQPHEILDEPWFMDNVIKHPKVAGAIRSLLGKDFALPPTIANHRSVCPQPGQDWHLDGGAKHDGQLNTLLVFYYPEPCPREMGPTEIVPGSHFLYTDQSRFIGHHGRIRGSYHTTASAGTIFLAHYAIWHRRSESWGSGVRNNLKFWYWRTSPPKRDWIKTPGFSLSTAEFEFSNDFTDTHTPTFRDQFDDCADSAKLYTWLCGKSEEVNMLGATAWPISYKTHRWKLPKQYGAPEHILGE